MEKCGETASLIALQLLHMKEWRAVQLLHQTYVLTLTLDESLTTAQKHSVLSNYISTIKKSDQTCIRIHNYKVFEFMSSFRYLSRNLYRPEELYRP
jgi:hypothetical protein